MKANQVANVIMYFVLIPALITFLSDIHPYTPRDNISLEHEDYCVELLANSDTIVLTHDNIEFRLNYIAHTERGYLWLYNLKPNSIFWPLHFRFYPFTKKLIIIDGIFADNILVAGNLKARVKYGEKIVAVSGGKPKRILRRNFQCIDKFPKNFFDILRLQRIE